MNTGTTFYVRRWFTFIGLLLAASALANAPMAGHFPIDIRNGKQWQFQFDAANRLTNTITPLGRTTTLTFDKFELYASNQCTTRAMKINAGAASRL